MTIENTALDAAYLAIKAIRDACGVSEAVAAAELVKWATKLHSLITEDDQRTQPVEAVMRDTAK